MTTKADILGRPPARKPTPEPEYRSDDDSWRGERFLKVERSPHGGGSFSLGGAIRKSTKTRKRKT